MEKQNKNKISKKKDMPAGRGKDKKNKDTLANRSRDKKNRDTSIERNNEKKKRDMSAEGSKYFKTNEMPADGSRYRKDRGISANRSGKQKRDKEHDRSEAKVKKQSWKAGNMLYPVPAVMVSCGRKGEKPNIITVAWTGTVCSDPAMVSISIRPERYSYDIIKETGAFVINLTTTRLIKAADFCGVHSGRDTDKFRELKLTAGKAFKVSCPIIEESPVNIECRVKQRIHLGSHDMFLAEVVCVDVSEEYLDNKGSFSLDKTGLTVYSHGEYFALGKKLGKFGYSVKKRSNGRKS